MQRSRWIISFLVIVVGVALAGRIIWQRAHRIPMPRIAGYTAVEQGIIPCAAGGVVGWIGYNAPGSDPQTWEIILIFASAQDVEADRPFIAIQWKVDDPGGEPIRILIDTNRDGYADEIYNTMDEVRTKYPGGPCTVLPKLRPGPGGAPAPQSTPRDRA